MLLLIFFFVLNSIYTINVSIILFMHAKFKFRSGTHVHGLNEELGRHRGKVRRNVPCVGMSVRM